ncbi:hypothetical protein A2291_04195 [candidate division WOR-1 bacterium RIFOXYB2_FULL_42_35]|uniref:Uncharacterized protein n=1 Tax=candidate division WOR-1 bacterium RIFOXYC2_FULL_41_25 TaxID=1802586 RepID=A0A1F4TMW9_UNCSA|nr:MAG: hypothetical protein A2247_01035 [candidate division WOR-1 bacterium RIFOXYA2_FULL_41_14]OGC24332.1 MAG: hypothetical protein A2291_04195 [candidate division WOR-1 bacterium RIFOXYB2_FULL_42_35]OGC34034.1 MAG: hypothetical protein A2462_01600 [candidate division WOR-1 bacterium RIFOXYC2_FULL_41_25]OGC42349.1 MAG: hypothetical protein A2548_07310 [candidate division WOR-1 bacterium RIFOXYD2_FULL_41_8]
MNNFDIVLVANSPGELSALVKPVAETLAAKHPDTRIILVLTPCQYTSGKELDYVETIKGISQTITANGYKNWILLNKKPEIDFKEKGVVLFLGGDLAHAMLVAKKLKYPASAYVQDYIGWTKFYQNFFIPDEATRRKLDPKDKLRDKIKVVGNLMVDSVVDLHKWAPDKNVITFLPGSRNWQIKHTTPIYEKIIQVMRNANRVMGNGNCELKFQLVSSPFVEAIPIAGVKTIPLSEVHNSELVITIPGTNTARLAAQGIPMLVIFPLDDLDVIPLEGIAHYICSIPYFGSKIKQKLADMMNKNTQFFALPNIKAGKEVVEEIRGIIDEQEVANKALVLLNNHAKRLKMSQELIVAMGQPGAAAKVAQELL